MKLDAILFDLDGTLIDSAPTLTQALNLLFKQYKLNTIDTDFLRPFVPYGGTVMLCAGLSLQDEKIAFGNLKQLISRIKSINIQQLIDNKQILLDEFDEVIQRLLNQFIDYYLQVIKDTALFDGMAETITMIEEQNIPWGIVTNKVRKLSEEIMQYLELSPQTLICSDDVQQTKPHPEALGLACEELNVASTNCVYIGDAHSDILAASAINMPSAVAMYGYIPKQTDPRTWLAQFYFETPQHIQQWLRISSDDSRQAS